MPYAFFPKLIKLIALPYAILAGTISHFYDWQRSGIIASKKMRYLAYFFLIWLNVTIWGCHALGAIIGCDFVLPNFMLLICLITMFLVLGLTNYIPRHPPFSQRRKIFVFTTFVLAVTLLTIAHLQFMSSKKHVGSLTTFGIMNAFACVMSIIRPQETRYGPCQCSSCKK
jgi:hypothetical protein